MFSNQNICTFFLAASSLFVAVATAPNHINFNLLNLLARSQDSNAYCVISYMSAVQEISDELESKREICSNNADKQRNDVNSESTESLKSLANRTEIYCKNIFQCKEQSTVEIGLECYRDEGNGNSKGFQNVSNEAATDLTKHMQKMSFIRYSEDICIEEAKTIFNAESTEAIEKLDRCLKGEGWPTPSPTPKPTTSTTTSIATTTVEVTTTTERKETTPSNPETTTESLITESVETTTQRQQE